jgi:hypothetical protein
VEGGFSEVRTAPAHCPVTYQEYLSEVLHLRNAGTIRLLHIQERGVYSALHPDEKREGTQV